MDSEARVTVHLNIYYKLLQWLYYKVIVRSSTQRKLDRICGQGIQRKGRSEQLSLVNGEVMELKFIKHDEAL